MTEFKVGDKVKIKEAMWTDISLIKYGFNKDEYEIVSTVFGEGTYSSLNFYGKKGRYDAAYFELVEEEKVKNRFAVGDRVISIKNTPEVPEGFIGYVHHVAADDNYDYAVENLGVAEYFKEDELELLSAAKQNLKDIKIPYDSVGLSFDDPKIKLTPADFTGIKASALDKQVSGDHYKDCKIQPIEYIHANGLSYLEGNVIKYTTRHSKKNGRKDIEKAIHYLELILEMEYKEI